MSLMTEKMLDAINGVYDPADTGIVQRAWEEEDWDDPLLALILQEVAASEESDDPVLLVVNGLDELVREVSKVREAIARLQ